ncbi:hypothetical protein COY59_04855 [Candidatus Gottesmanbacteria bacterium CG_4_10_14_0_8_um_filter_37_24]|uniref:Uncharacterized protein n=1 Tax=Candidatus Gottesmanbacteria bacterium CG_4_10_14_0_8_um_filter_37_24 TaxID=1974574 RepID=A0A2M7RQ21_9BACT|nr:MAG: hypothetical protein COY59_04855 [Candidatus Gottesmanbacteria bacterium CG_4_10_14_0_8_um_filter_37_24]
MINSSPQKIPRFGGIIIIFLIINPSFIPTVRSASESNRNQPVKLVRGLVLCLTKDFTTDWELPRNEPVEVHPNPEG